MKKEMHKLLLEVLHRNVLAILKRPWERRDIADTRMTVIEELTTILDEARLQQRVKEDSKKCLKSLLDEIPFPGTPNAILVRQYLKQTYRKISK